MFKKMLLLMTVVLLSVSSPLLALDYIFWTGAVSSDITDANNWDPAELPTASSVVMLGVTSDWANTNHVPLNQPVLTSVWGGEGGDPNGGWWILRGPENSLTIADGAFITFSKNACNLRNGSTLRVTGQSPDGGPSLVIPPKFHIAHSGDDMPDTTGTLLIEENGFVRFDPSVAVSGSGGNKIYLGGAANALIDIQDDGILELVSGTEVGSGEIDTPQFAFASSDPNVNKVVISGDGQLLLAGDPVTGMVDDVETSLEEMIDMGLITSDTGITVSGSNPTVVKALPSPFTVVDLPAIGTDADIGIDPGKTYTHTLDFGTNAPAVINGVAFDQGPGEVRELYEGVSSQGYGYILDDTRSDFVSIHSHKGNDPSAYADGASAEMLRDMLYHSNNPNANDALVLTLKDLTPGTEYSFRWYYRPWDPPLPRPITVIADGGESIDIDIDLCGGAQYLDYTFVADDNDVTMEFATNNYGQGVHLYGITCEVVPPQAQDPGTEGLLAYYAMEGDATDGSGNGNDGVIMGDPGFVDGAAGQAIDLDGDGDYIDCGANPLFGMQETNEMTVATWVTIRSVAHQWAAIVAKGEYSWRLGIASRDPIFHFGIAWGLLSDTTFFDGVTAVGFDEWHHVAAVFDGANMMIYLDGALDNSVPTTEKIGTKADETNVLIGENPKATGRYWNGLIDEVLIYNRALSEDEIAFLAQ